MAYIKTTAILTRLREVAEEALGSVRTIDQDRFTGGLHDGLVAQEQAKLGTLSKKPVEATITAVRPHPQRLVITGSVQIVELDVSIKVVRAINIDGQVDNETRDAVKGVAAEDADVLCQALEWPANLATTLDGTSTDLKGLKWVQSAAVVTGVAGSAMTLTTTHTFRGTALSRPATT